MTSDGGGVTTFFLVPHTMVPSMMHALRGVKPGTVPQDEVTFLG